MGQVRKWTAMTRMMYGDDLVWNCQEGDGPLMPDMYDTEREVQIEIARNTMREIQEFIDGEREWDEVMWEPDSYPVQVMIDDHGNMVVYRDGKSILATTLEKWREGL